MRRSDNGPGRSSALALALWLSAAAGAPPVLAKDLGVHEVDSEPSRANKAQPVAVSDPTAAQEAASGTADDLVFGGVFRTRYDVRYDSVSLAGVPKTAEHFSFDTAGPKLKYDTDTLFGAAQYRFYGGSFLYGPRNGYVGYPGEVSFPLWAYLGYKLTSTDSISAGFSQTPFGLLPYFSTSYLETLGFTMGLEEVYNLGLRYEHVEPRLNVQLAVYPRSTPNAFGLSRDSARYSTSIVLADKDVPFGANNAERNMIVARAEYVLFKAESAILAVGASIWHSDIDNLDTRRTGSKQLEGLHVNATLGPWGFKGIYVRQDLAPRNPVRSDILTIGGFDSSYNMASHGNFVSGEVNYKLPGGVGPFETVTYLDYGAYYKDRADFRNSERVILGTAWTLKADPRLIIYTEGDFGRNDPDIGAGQFLTGLAQGGDNRWKTEFIMSIGYYF